MGIFSAEWKLTGGFDFETPEELEEFRQSIKDSFEMIADDRYVETFEERKVWMEAEDKIING